MQHHFWWTTCRVIPLDVCYGFCMRYGDLPYHATLLFYGGAYCTLSSSVEGPIVHPSFYGGVITRRSRVCMIETEGSHSMTNPVLRCLRVTVDEPSCRVCHSKAFRKSSWQDCTLSARVRQLLRATRRSRSKERALGLPRPRIVCCCEGPAHRMKPTGIRAACTYVTQGQVIL